MLVLNGDAPLIDSETINGALEKHCQEQNAVTVISARVDNPYGYGRIVIDHRDGSLARIVEERMPMSRRRGSTRSTPARFGSMVLHCSKVSPSCVETMHRGSIT